MFLLCLLLALYPTSQEGQAVVLPTSDPDVFHVIYEADMKWNVIVTLYDDRGKKRFDTEIKNSDRFKLPLNLKGESSGRYTIELSTPAYDLRQEFVYLTLEDRLAGMLNLDYLGEKHIIRLESREIMPAAVSVFIYNEQGERLIMDEISPSGATTYRSYNLDGAPALKFEIIIMTSGKVVRRETFDY